MRGRLAGSDDPDPEIVAGLRVDMDDNKNRDTAHKAYGMPSLLPRLDPVGKDHVQRIVPDLLRKLEGDPVLQAIAVGLCGVPFKGKSSL